jgi:hypothetical protein
MAKTSGSRASGAGASGVTSWYKNGRNLSAQAAKAVACAVSLAANQKQGTIGGGCPWSLEAR